NGQVSFTPLSFIMYIDMVVLFPELVENEFGEMVGGSTGDQSEIYATLEQEIDLINQDGLSELITQNLEVDSSDFGHYIGVKVLCDTLVKVSGTYDVNGAEYSFTDLEIASWGGYNTVLPGGLDVSDDSTTTLQILFDAENAFLLERWRDGTHNVQVDTAGVYADLTGMLIFPYAGNDAPSVEKYQITWEGALESNYFMELVLLKGPDGNVANAGWRNIYLNGFTLDAVYGAHIDPHYLYDAQIATNDDGSINISDGYVPDDVIDKQLVIPAFQLQDHSGTFIYGSDANGQEIPYTARQITQ
ncbi:MAG TPA: hypothetical protein VKA68_01245, partial [bacterium]|nr:hypothetical protein [bacterium]